MFMGSLKLNNSDTYKLEFLAKLPIGENSEKSV